MKPMQISRRGLLKAAGAGAALSSMGALGFGALEQAAAASVRPYKLAAMRRDAQHLPLLLRRLRHHHVQPRAIAPRTRRRASCTSRAIRTIPVNRGTLCPKGAALHRLRARPTPGPSTRYIARPAQTSCKRVSWDCALDRIARLMKDDRDKNFIAKNADGVHGQPLDHHRHAWRLGHDQRDRLSAPTRWSAALGHGSLRQPSAGLTRTDGGQSGPNVRPRRDDQPLAGHQERRRHHPMMGGNAAEAHPCGFKWVIEAKVHNNARLIVVDPRFTRTASVADLYCADPAGHRHRVPERRDQAICWTTTRSSTST